MSEPRCEGGRARGGAVDLVGVVDDEFVHEEQLRRGREDGVELAAGTPHDQVLPPKEREGVGRASHVALGQVLDHRTAEGDAAQQERPRVARLGRDSRTAGGQHARLG